MRENQMQRICVFCASNIGNDPAFALAAESLGQALAARKIGLVYGGGKIGLMGIIADAVMNSGGQAIGVIPQALVDKELAHRGITELRTVRSMHERKALMAELSDGFVALPGGFGTLEELCEILTWAQLGLHKKPFGLLNISGFYDHFLRFLDHIVETRLLRPQHRELVLHSTKVDDLLTEIASWQPAQIDKWIAPEET
jgi:uncharacterized protein (TIGR00730 family)